MPLPSQRHEIGTPAEFFVHGTPVPERDYGVAGSGILPAPAVDETDVRYFADLISARTTAIVAATETTISNLRGPQEIETWRKQIAAMVGARTL